MTLTNGVPSYSFYRDGTAERQISEDRLTAASQQTPGCFIGSLALAGGADADVWEALSARCKQAGIAVSLDPNVRAGLIADPDSYRARLARMMQLADIIKLSDEDLTWIYPDQSEQDALAQLVKDSGASVLVLTRGENGASLFHDGQWHDEPVAPMDELKARSGRAIPLWQRCWSGWSRTGLSAIWPVCHWVISWRWSGAPHRPRRLIAAAGAVTRPLLMRCCLKNLTKLLG